MQRDKEESICQDSQVAGVMEQKDRQNGGDEGSEGESGIR